MKIRRSGYKHVARCYKSGNSIILFIYGRYKSCLKSATTSED